MVRKTAFLTGVAGALFMAAPAFAQDAPLPAQQPVEQTAPAQPSLTLQPGATVRGSDGETLGRLAGVRVNLEGEQELTVRSADGQIRSVPLGGLRQEGADVVVGWTAEEFNASPALPPETAAPEPAPLPEPPSDDDAD